MIGVWNYRIPFKKGLFYIDFMVVLIGYLRIKVASVPHETLRNIGKLDH